MRAVERALYRLRNSFCTCSHVLPCPTCPSNAAAFVAITSRDIHCLMRRRIHGVCPPPTKGLMAPDMAVRITVQRSPDCIDCKMHQHSVKRYHRGCCAYRLRLGHICILLQQAVCIILWRYCAIGPRRWLVNRVGLHTSFSIVIDTVFAEFVMLRSKCVTGEQSHPGALKFIDIHRRYMLLKLN